MNLAITTIRLLCAVLCMGVLWACGGADDARKGPAPAPVSVSTVYKRDMERTLHVVGNVQASASVGIKTRVTGALLDVHFREGDHVNAGQLLFTIDPRPYEAALRESTARLAKDQAQLQKAIDDMRRYGKLVGEGYVSREAYDKAATDAAALRATVQADTAAVESAALQLAYCSIEAPISGRAGEIRMHKGNMIKANDESPILTIDTLRPIYVSFAVPEAHLPAIQAENAKGTVRIIATPSGGVPAQGVLDLIANTVDMRTGTIRLRAIFDNAHNALWPGQYVQVAVALGTVPDALVVPAQAVQAGRNETYVYVVVNNTAEYRKVRQELENDGLVVLSEGVSEGEYVVTDGQVRLAPGVPVTVQ